MKIIQLITARQLRGAEVFANQLANKLIEQGHEVMLVSLYTFKTQKLVPQRAAYTDLNGEKKGLSFRLLRSLFETIRTFQPDVVQANAGDTLKYAVLSKLMYRWSCPIVFRNASMVSRYIRNPLVKRFNQWLYRNTKAIISVTSASRDDLVRLFPEVEKKITVIPIGIEIGKVPVVDKKPFQIIHIGGFTFEKNHEGLLRIFDLVRKSYPQATLLLVGDGPLRNSIEEKVSKTNMEDRILFKGSVSDPLRYLVASAVLVLPSVIEGLPGVILEAFFCKVPVVTYDVGGVKEIVDATTGKLIPQGREDAFADAVCEILAGKDDAINAMTDKACEHVIRYFDNKAIALQFLEVYRSVGMVKN